MSSVRLVVEGHHLPGRRCGSHSDVHVGVQVGPEPTGLLPADVETARWEVEVGVVRREGGVDPMDPMDPVDPVDFRGRAVHGRRGGRFVYLTWGEGSGGDFVMFRRAKLMLDEMPDPSADEVVVRVHLTDEQGLPRCARLRPPAVGWTAAEP